MMNEQTKWLVDKAEEHIANRMREPDWLRSSDVNELLELRMRIELVKVLSEVTVERDDG